MKVREAKKLLKEIKCSLRPERKLNEHVSWNRNKKVFLVKSYFGQTSLVLSISKPCKKKKTR
jgi:hypothetical protein